MTPHTLTCTFTYNHLRGTFTGVLPNGTHFEFVCASDYEAARAALPHNKEGEADGR